MTLSRHDKESPQSPFDSIRHVDEQGNEFWLARELMPLLGYIRWERVPSVIERAKLACQNSGNSVSWHFSEEARKTGGRDGQDYKLSRYGCHLVAMNGDPRKPEIAAAQSYFAVKTREAELKQQPAKQLPPPPTPEERLQMGLSGLKQLGIDLGNPRYSQGLKDWALNLMGVTPQPLLSGDRWLSTAERAEELGFGRIGSDLSKRVRLGQWVGKYNLERRKEKRLVNGTNQGIWCYRVCSELDEAISGFFGGEP